MASEKEFPYCPVVLAVGALACHFLVLMGNMKMASEVSHLGAGSYGWADMGYEMATAMNDTLAEKLHETSAGMTEAILMIMTARTLVDELLTNASKTLKPSLMQQESNRDGAMDVNSTEFLISGVKLLKDAAKKILEKMKPVLLQVQKWLVSFGDKVQAGIEVFTLTLDTVQQIFDQIMVQLKGTGANEDAMLHHTYSLFDVSNTGKVSAFDLADVANMYGITLLQDEKGSALFKKYDADQDQSLSVDELRLLSHDSTVKGVLAVVLRAYASRLSAAAGKVASAKTRDEVARTVVQYMSIVCSKNKTKVEWMADALTNGSLPLEFTSSVLANLALSSESPAALTKDVGAMYVERLVEMKAAYVAEAVLKMKEVTFWQNEGLDLKDQARCVETVAQWVLKAKKAPAALPFLMASFSDLSDDPKTMGGMTPHGSVAEESDQSTFMQYEAEVESADDLVLVQTQTQTDDGDLQALVQTHRRVTHMKKGLAGQRARREASADRSQDSKSVLEAEVELAMQLPRLARQHVERQHRQHREAERSHRARRRAEQHAALAMFESSSLAKVHRALSTGEDDPDAVRVVKAGVPAQNDTLRFAQFLSYNATDTAEMLQHECFEYTSQADGPTENVATRITGMVKAIQSVLAIIKQHATPRAVDNLEKMIDDFAQLLENDVLSHLEAEKAKLAAASLIEQPDTVEKTKELAKKSGNFVLQKVVDAWLKIKPLLDDLTSMMPSAINYMKVAREEVSTASQIMKSQFSVFRMKGHPIFDRGAGIHRKVWTVYFVLAVIFTLTMPIYALWAAGKFGGPGSEYRQEGYEPPASYRERCALCWKSCCSCFGEFHNTQEFLWSFIILMEVCWLPLLMVSIVFAILVAVEAFVVKACSPVYILSDDVICTEAMEGISDFLDSVTFYAGMSLKDICETRSLLVCKDLGEEMFRYVLCTVVGSFIASFLVLEMILDSAARWERYRYERLLSEAVAGKS
mmetsp:Transcript_8009/g.14664  ORF Transcript_8009/g.14664 Transcript_8009/m.14664 type:complete len:978 (-) Transcript_8009:101-3034(-)